jgi:hypothetical protein
MEEALEGDNVERSNKEERISLRVTPSQKRIFQDEAKRCNTSVSKVVIEYTTARIKPEKDTTPTPTIYRHLVRVARTFYHTIEDEGALLRTEIMDLQTDLSLKLSKLESVKEKRKELRNKSVSEKCKKVITLRLSTARLTWLKEKTKSHRFRSDRLSSLLRRQCMQGLKERELIESAIGWLERWVNRADDILDGRTNDSKNELQASKEIAKDIEDTITEESLLG